jgi:hypothetical protein
MPLADATIRVCSGRWRLIAHDTRGQPPARRLLSFAGMYHTGDFVYPTDLPRRFLCRVTEEESFRVETGTAQILKLAPLEGPWPEGTLLVRPDVWVRAARRGCTSAGLRAARLDAGRSAHPKARGAAA